MRRRDVGGEAAVRALSKREDSALLMGRQPRLARAASSCLCSNAASSA